MTTILTPITPEELQKIKAGKNFFLLFTRVAPQVGQPLILQAAEDEFATTIEYVQGGDGLMKNYYLLAWNVGITAPTIERQSN